MKKTLSLFLAIVLTLGVFCTVPIAELPLGITAEAASVSDLTFELEYDELSYYVDGCKTSAKGSLTIPSNYNGKSVTRINSYAFVECTGLTSITIPNSVTSIDSSAFRGCTKLTAINVSSDNKNYTSVNGVLFNKNKTELIKYPEGKTNKSYSIPNTVKSIGDYAFGDCTGLTSITIPNSVTNIGESAFEDCTGLTSVKIGTGAKIVGDYAFYGCKGLTSITIPNNVTSMGDGAFGNCTELTSVKIGTGIKTVGEGTFYGCKGLTLVTIPNNVTSIGESAFEECTGLTSVKIGTDVKTIARRAFRHCSSLTSITIPKNVTSIGNYAFIGCTKLTAINVSKDNAKYTSVSGVLFNKNKTALIKYPEGQTNKSYSVPNTVKSISDYAFCSCKALTSVTIPNNVTSIGESAFQNCTGLKSVEIPSGLKVLEYTVFKGCKSLATVSLPATVTEISYGSFAGCGKLKSVKLPSSLSSFDKSAFLGCTSLSSISVPESNKYFSTKNGVLFDKKQTQLKLYPEGKNATSYVVSGSVKSIEYDAFSQNDYLKTVTIPNSVTSIGYRAFEDCKNLKTVQVGKNADISGSELGYYHDNDSRVKISGFTVYGISGTKAQTYAKDNGFKFVNVTKPGTVKLSGAANASTGVKVSWSKVDNVSSYTVYRKSGSNGYKAIKSGITGTSYIDTTAKSNNTYTYTVRATNVAGTGGYNKTGKTVKYIAAPKLSTVANTNSGIALKWNKITGAAGYCVYRKVGNGDYKKNSDRQRNVVYR